MSEVRVVILDDHPIVRAGLRMALESVDGVHVVGEASTIDEFVELVQNTTPRVALVDLYLGPDSSGHDAIAEVAARFPDTRTVVVTAFDNERDIRTALDAGAAGYVLKDAPESDLVAAVLAAADGQTPLAPQVATRLVSVSSSNPESLTQRELEVLLAVSEGKDNASIAKDLFISQATVKSHLNKVFTKLDVTTRTGAVVEARRRGLIR